MHNNWITFLCYFATLVIIITGADYINRHTDDTAMKVCELSHSHATCFEALNR